MTLAKLQSFYRHINDMAAALELFDDEYLDFVIADK